MLNKETKQHIDNSRDILVGQLPLPTDQVELITIALIYKFMDDIDVSAKELGGSATYFKGDLAQLSWRKIISNTLSAEERVTKFIASIEGISKAKHIPDLFKSIFKNTFLKFRDGRILKMFMDEIDWFTYSHSEELGNAFEYLLNTMGAQGDNGQFRTPRNIIDFIVEVVDPKKTDSILDPACGTGGFLISAYKHILWANTKGYEDYSITLGNYNIEGKKIHKGNKLTQDERKALVKNIVGYDITPLMQRLSKVNMYLHDIPNPIIQDYDTLSLDTRWNEKYDCILANPPFMTPKGGVQPHDKFRIKANTTEVLFSDYMLEHLTPNGKAGWIVPEGIIFQNNNDYVDLRRWLVEEAGLWAVVSLPAQIFQPYSGVKTSILLIDRKLARERDSIILVKVENDGFSLNTNRNPIDKNDLPGALKILRSYKSSPKTPPLTKERMMEGSTENIKYLILPRREFEKIDSYKAYTTGWELCRKAFVKVIAARSEYDEVKKNKPAEKEKERAEKIWIRRWDEFRSRTNYNKTELGSEAEFKFWFEENLKDTCISYGEDPHAPIKMKKGGVYFPEELKKRIDNEREYNLSFDKYNGNGEKREHIHKVVKLGDICEVLDRLRKPVTEKDRKSGKYPYYGAMGIVDYVNEFIFDERLLLIAEDGGKWGLNEKKAFIADGKYWVNNHAHVIRIMPELASDTFIQYFLNSIDLKDYISGAVVPKLTQGNMRSIPIPLPPLEIQQKIVAEIEGYQKVIDGCNAVIENYKPTFKIDEKWEKKRIAEIADLDYGYTASAKGKGEYRYIRITDIDDACRLTNTEIKYVDYDPVAKDAIVQKGDLFVARTGATYGKCVLIEEEVKAIYASYLIRIRFKTNLAPKYFWGFAQSELYWTQARSLVSGAGQPQFNGNAIGKVIVPIPPVNIQKTIVEEIEEDHRAVDATVKLKLKLESQIKAVIDGVWGKAKTELKV